MDKDSTDNPAEGLKVLAASGMCTLDAMSLPMSALLLCNRDPGPFTETQAHMAMQVHLDCAVDTCKVRCRARTTLVDAKRMVLDERAIPAPASRRLA